MIFHLPVRSLRTDHMQLPFLQQEVWVWAKILNCYSITLHNNHVLDHVAWMESILVTAVSCMKLVLRAILVESEEEKCNEFQFA